MGRMLWMLALVGTVAVAAVAGPADGYRRVKSWRGTIAVTVDDTETAGGITTHMKGELDATFGPLVLDAAVSTPAGPVWAARAVAGRMTVATTAQDTAMKSTMQWTGAGAVPRDAEVRLALDLDAGTYELHVYTGAVDGTYTADVMGQRETRPDRVSIGGMTRTFQLPALDGAPRRIAEHFKCSFADCYVHGIPAAVDKRSIDVAFVLEPELAESTGGGCRSSSRAVLAIGLGAMVLRLRRRFRRP